MKTQWFHQQGSENLIVFCNGWGMDGTPFTPLQSRDHDVLGYHDYSNMSGGPNIVELSKNYKKIHLICWSMGVAHGHEILLDAGDMIDKSIAINGTLQPIDDRYGIPVDICTKTLEALSEESLLKFYKRMCRSTAIYEQFIKNRPQRSLSDLRGELEVIIDNTYFKDGDNILFKTAIVSESDLVIPTRNQLRFWKKDKITKIKSSHFPFYRWESWEDILALAC